MQSELTWKRKQSNGEQAKYKYNIETDHCVWTFIVTKKIPKTGKGAEDIYCNRTHEKENICQGRESIQIEK